MKHLVLLLSLLAAACASTPPATYSSSSDGTRAERAAGNALKMVGRPYHYGGSTPTGFDCSGLVQYSYKQAGLTLPRDTEKQRLSGRHIQKAELRRGDLIFFDQEGKKNSHVGIYLGEGRFVHAPSSGKQVRSDRLDSPYWKKHFSEARRVSA